VADQQRMPWAPLPKAPLEVWVGIRACGCLEEVQEDAPNAATVAAWRASGVVRIKKVDAYGLRRIPVCTHLPVREPLQPSGEPVKVPGKRPSDPAPEGLWRAVCVDNHDLGLKEVTFKGKTKELPKVLIVWELEELNPKNENRPFLAYARYTVSMDPKASLAKMLESWRGKKYTPEERAAGVDLDLLVGVPCQIQITHNHSDDGTIWANVTGVLPLARGQEKLKPSGQYERMQDRKDNAPEAAAVEAAGPDDDIPF
jgi:hypothetical protein